MHNYCCGINLRPRQLLTTVDRGLIVETSEYVDHGETARRPYLLLRQMSLPVIIGPAAIFLGEASPLFSMNCQNLQKKFYVMF